VLEGAKAVENEGLRGCLLGSSLFVEEQAVSAEPFRDPLDRAVRDLELARDLTQSRAGHEPMEDGFEKPAVPEPVGVREGL
jgi:hypothetical protein